MPDPKIKISQLDPIELGDVTGLQTQLDGKLPTGGIAANSSLLDGFAADAFAPRGGYAGSTQDLQNAINGISTEGIKHYQDTTNLPSTGGLATGTTAKVVNDTDPSQNGYYSITGGNWLQNPPINDYEKSNASVHRKNLVQDRNWVDDKYVAVSGGGSFNTLAGYSVSGYVPIKENAIYQVNPAAGIYHQWAYYDYNNTFISGVTAKPTRGYFKTPSGTKFAAFSIKDSDAAVYSVTEIVDQKSVWVVSKDANRDFDTVQDAIDASEINAGRPQTIYIKNGTYTEELNAQGKTVRLVGENKYSTIILQTSGEYANPPLECDTNIYIENLTLKHTNQAPTVPSVRGYALHLDYTGEGTAEFNHVIFESHQNAGAGIGLHLNQTLVFNNCSFYKYDGGLATYAGGGFYIHNASNPVDGQRLIMRDCYVWTESGAAIRIDDAAMNASNVDTDTVFQFTNNTFWSEEHGSGSNAVYLYNAPTDGGFAGRIKLHGASHGNNISVFNA